jgi:hypothetical protein
MYICDRSIDSVSFYDWSIILWNCSHSVVFFSRFFLFETDHFETDQFKVDYSLNWSDQRNVASISNEIGIITQRERTQTVSIQCIMYIWQLIWLFEIHIMQTVHATELFVILYTTDQNYSNQNTIGCIMWTLLIHILIHMYIEQM